MNNLTILTKEELHLKISAWLTILDASFLLASVDEVNDERYVVLNNCLHATRINFVPIDGLLALERIEVSGDVITYRCGSVSYKCLASNRLQAVIQFHSDDLISTLPLETKLEAFESVKKFADKLRHMTRPKLHDYKLIIRDFTLSDIANIQASILIHAGYSVEQITELMSYTSDSNNTSNIYSALDEYERAYDIYSSYLTKLA